MPLTVSSETLPLPVLPTANMNSQMQRLSEQQNAEHNTNPRSAHSTGREVSIGNQNIPLHQDFFLATASFKTPNLFSVMRIATSTCL